MTRAVCALAICAGFTGCVKKPPVWQLASNSLTLTPPAEKRTTITAGAKACPPTSGIAIVRRGRTLRVSVAPDALTDKPAGWLRKWSTEIEAQDCIPPGTALDFATLIVQSIPLDPANALTLLHETNRDAIDLDPSHRLQVTAPLLRAGSDISAPLLAQSTVTGQGNQINVDVKTSPDLLGYEVIWYAFQPRPGGIGHRLVPVNSERHFTDRLEKSDTPTHNYLALPPEAAFYKMVYKAQVDAQSVAELLVAAPSLVSLEKAAAEVVRTGSCPPSQGPMCLPIPRRVGVNSVLFVNVNGAETPLTRGSGVSAALQAAGAADPKSLLPTLKILKQFRGAMIPIEFDRHSPAILNLQLLGGEQISWTR